MRLAFVLLILIGAGCAALGLVHAQSTANPGVPAVSTPVPPGGIVHGLLYEKHLTAGLACAACHGDAPPATPAGASTCLTCHGPVSALIEKTTADQPNPHADAHIGKISCTDCHHIHVASESFCNKCHTFDMEVP